MGKDLTFIANEKVRKLAEALDGNDLLSDKLFATLQGIGALVEKKQKHQEGTEKQYPNLRDEEGHPLANPRLVSEYEVMRAVLLKYAYGKKPTLEDAPLKAYYDLLHGLAPNKDQAPLKPITKAQEDEALKKASILFQGHIEAKRAALAKNKKVANVDNFPQDALDDVIRQLKVMPNLQAVIETASKAPKPGAIIPVAQQMPTGTKTSTGPKSKKLGHAPTA